jgi:YegS/Rv2252/BmrU family lipid kinase
VPFSIFDLRFSIGGIVLDAPIFQKHQSEARAVSRKIMNAGPVYRTGAVNKTIEQCTSTKDLCVIFNPAAARGRSGFRFRHLQRMLAKQAEFQASREAGHAEELAYAAAQSGFKTVVAAGGDGTVHEVANGVLRAARMEVGFGVLPLGSGNDYAVSLDLPHNWPLLCERLISGKARMVDVGEVRDETGRSRYFVNTIGLGLSGAVTFESRRIHGLRGLALYGLAAVRAIWRHFQAPNAILTIDGQRWELPTLYLCIALGQREGGGFIIAPQAELDDGLFDYLHAGRMSRWQALSYLPRLALGKIPENDPVIRRGRCRAVVYQSESSVLAHLDGELFTRPGDDVRRLEIHLLPRALRIQGALP